jgi:hypothetical protein
MKGEMDEWPDECSVKRAAGNGPLWVFHMSQSIRDKECVVPRPASKRMLWFGHAFLYCSGGQILVIMERDPSSWNHGYTQ